MEDPVVPLERNLYGHPWAGLLWERQLGKLILEHGWKQAPNLENFFNYPRKGTILVCVCGRSKTGWKETKH